MINRIKTKEVRIGKLKIGANNPILIQSMNNTDTRDVEASLRQIYHLAGLGCDITRLAVPDEDAAKALKFICMRSPIPVVADIHFDYKLAILAVKNGAAKIRINPGNIGGSEKLRKVCQIVKTYSVPMRIGVNSGSIPKRWINKYEGINAQSLTACALDAVRQVEELGIEDIVISLKSSNPLLTIEAYKLLATKTSYPLHIGVTEAGTLKEGVIRSAVGIGSLLSAGIGDTLRVSLTADPAEEVKAAWSILKALDLRTRGISFISCPTCGRTEVNLSKIAMEIEEKLSVYDVPLKVAVMGCVVNGPGEAQDADFGIAGGKDEFILFAKGKMLRRIKEDEAIPVLMKLIDDEVKKIKTT